VNDRERFIVPSGSPLRGIYTRNGVPQGGGDTTIVPPDRYLLISRGDQFGVAVALIASADWGKNGVLYCSNKHRFMVRAEDLERLAEDVSLTS